MSLVEFLLARITEDEAAQMPAMAGLRGWGKNTGRRALAECAAKRRIIERFQQEQPKTGWDQHDHLGRAVNRMACSLFLGVLRELAQPYAGHPDFDLTWSAE